MIRFAVIMAITLVYVFTGRPDVEEYLALPYMTRALVYPFLHANLFHLLVNTYATFLLFDPGRKDNMRCLVMGYIISFIVYPLSFRPVIGISNLLYAVIGLRTPPFYSPFWRNPMVILFLSVTVLMVFIPSIAATTHVASFILGMLTAMASREIKSVYDDGNRIFR